MEQDRLILRLQKFECANEQRNIVTIDRSVVAQTELLENHTRHKQVFHAFFDLVRQVQRGLASDRPDEFARLFVQILEGRIRDDIVQVGCNRADVFRDRPLVVVQDDDEAFRLRLDVVERLVADSAGKRGVARNHHDIFIRSAQIAPDCHAKRSGERRAGMTGAITIMFAFGAEQKSVKPFVLPHRIDAIEAAGKHFVDVALMADVEDEFVPRRSEDPMERDGEFDNAEIWSEMAAGLRENPDQRFAHFLRELWKVLFIQRLDVGGRTNRIEQSRRGFGLL